MVLSYDLLEDRCIYYVITAMVESFENLEVMLPDCVNENIEQSLAEAVDDYEKKEKKRFSEETDLEKLLEVSQSIAKRNTKWVVKLFQVKTG